MLASAPHPLCVAATMLELGARTAPLPRGPQASDLIRYFAKA